MSTAAAQRLTAILHREEALAIGRLLPEAQIRSLRPQGPER
jgi:hypothetical protein